MKKERRRKETEVMKGSEEERSRRETLREGKRGGKDRGGGWRSEKVKERKLGWKK